MVPRTLSAEVAALAPVWTWFGDMGLHREADPNVGAAFNIATHSVVLTPQTAHFGGQVQLPLARRVAWPPPKAEEDQLPEGFTDARGSASVRLIGIKCEGATP